MKISIVTPNYNYAEYIGQTIESVVTQDYGNIEHIIVDDGSTDNSVAIIKEYQQRYPWKIKLIQQENRGQTPAINLALINATGDIIGWLNSDDTYLQGTLKEVVKIFNKENTDIVFGDSNVIDVVGKFIYRLRHLKFSYFESVFVGFNNTLTSNTVFWKRELLNQVGLMKDSLKCNMDGEYFSRLTYRKKVVYLRKPLANFRKQLHTKASLSNSNWTKLINEEREQTQKEAYENLFISKYIPYKFSFPIRYILLFLRALRRIIYLHYIKKRIEIYSYRKAMR